MKMKYYSIDPIDEYFDENNIRLKKFIFLMAYEKQDKNDEDFMFYWPILDLRVYENDKTRFNDSPNFGIFISKDYKECLDYWVKPMHLQKELLRQATKKEKELLKQKFIERYDKLEELVD